MHREEEGVFVVATYVCLRLQEGKLIYGTRSVICMFLSVSVLKSPQLAIIFLFNSVTSLSGDFKCLLLFLVDKIQISSIAHAGHRTMYRLEEKVFAINRSN